MVDQENRKGSNANALPDVECVFAGYYVVAFVDLLGTDAKNAEIKSLPESDFPAALKREVDKVKIFQRDFYDFFENAARSGKEFRSQMPESLADREELQGNDVNSYAFSDSLIFYASLNTKQGRLVPVSSCFSILAALSCAQLWSLARGVPFRGGVEIGRAVTFYGNQILGPALSDAVKLEKQAQFPRILMGEEFHNYLQLHSRLPHDTLVNRANREYANICISYICESNEPCQLCEPDKTEDGRMRFSLDVHSEFVVDLIGKPHQELINKARIFAERELQRFSGQNETLACRYRHLLNYLKGER